MACYAANLVSGDNILCQTLKSGTIARYLSAAAELSTAANTINPCLDITGKQSRHIKDITNEVRRWEVIPDRREPVTKEIIIYIHGKGLKLRKNNANNLYSALADWLILGHQSGFRRKEWAQDRTYIKRHKDKLPIRNASKSTTTHTLTRNSAANLKGVGKTFAFIRQTGRNVRFAVHPRREY